MFIGHFGAGLAAKKLAPEINLGILFIFCQLLDLIWPVLVLLNIEQVSVDHSATTVTPLDFSHYPYSHSLVATILYSLVVALIVWRVLNSGRSGVLAFSVVLSHWIFDFLTHRPDLPLMFGGEKFGLGLWNSLWGTFLVEVGIFGLGIFLYLQSSTPVNRRQKILFWSLIAFLMVIYLGNIFGPKIPDNAPSAAIAGPALAMWLFVVWGFFADRKATNG